MALEGDWMNAAMVADGQDLDNYGIFLFPTGTGRLYAFAQGNYIGANSENKDVAAAFLDYFSSTEVQQEYLGVFGSISVNQEVVTPEDAGWREALDFEGSRYVGLVGQILQGFPITDMEPDWQETLGRRGLLIPGELFIAYAKAGGDLRMVGNNAPLRYRVVDPCSGDIVREGVRASHTESIPDEGGAPRVYICHNGFPSTNSR